MLICPPFHSPTNLKPLSQRLCPNPVSFPILKDSPEALFDSPFLRTTSKEVFSLIAAGPINLAVLVRQNFRLSAMVFKTNGCNNNKKLQEKKLFILCSVNSIKIPALYPLSVQIRVHEQFFVCWLVRVCICSRIWLETHFYCKHQLGRKVISKLWQLPVATKLNLLRAYPNGLGKFVSKVLLRP